MTYSVDIYDKNGKVVEQVSLNPEKFNEDLVNNDLIHEFYLLQTSNARKNIAKTKGRGEVHGSGRKMVKQKGTGGARIGDNQSPVRKGGGVAFGPRGVANYIKDMPKKARKLALYGMLTLKAKDNEICGLVCDMKSPKTKEANDILKKIGLSDKKVLVIFDKKDENMTKSFRNISSLKLLSVDYLNPYDIMNSDKMVFVGSALEKIN